MPSHTGKHHSRPPLVRVHRTINAAMSAHAPRSQRVPLYLRYVDWRSLRESLRAGTGPPHTLLMGRVEEIYGDPDEIEAMTTECEPADS